MALEKLTFLDEVGTQKLSEAILNKTNARISDRIVQELNDASDANHVVSAALLNTLLKARDTAIGDNTAAIATNKTDIGKIDADIDSMTTKVGENTTNVAAVASGITALDEKIAGLTHLTIDTVIGAIADVADPKSDVLYLQKDNEADTTWMLYIYREDGTWAQIGDTGVDLSDYWSKDDNDAIKDAVGVPEVTPLPEAKILAAIDAAFDNTDVLTPKDPNLQYLTITDAGAVSANATLRAMTKDTPVDLVIPSEINGIKVTNLGSFSECKALSSVVIPDSITTIPRRAFERCGSLTSVTLPDSITEIGRDAFSYSGLTSIVIPNGVTIIDDDVFASTKLTSVTIPGSVKTINPNAFGYCTKLTSVTISEGVTTINGMAFISSALTSITIPSTVETMGGAFQYCTELTTINVKKPANSLNGAPWGAPKATVNWLG